MATQQTTSFWKDHNSLLLLSLLWLSLCAGLVHKHHELVTVFFAFIGSFGLATILLTTKICTPIQAKRCVTGLAITASLYYWSNWNKGSYSSAGYQSLSVAAGYLAFDHWFSSMYCRPPFIITVIEDALTLTIILTLLVVAGHQLDAYPKQIGAWFLYRATRLIVSFVNQETPIVVEGGIKKEEEEVWIIHGQPYNLAGFQHPGGQEALLLGRGRDCTALFESYHPFTSKHREVLSKYSVYNTNNNPVKVPPKDYFYRVLCERVAQTLKAKNIDPIKERTANVARVLYYVAVLVAVGASAIGHCRVRVQKSLIILCGTL